MKFQNTLYNTRNMYVRSEEISTSVRTFSWTIVHTYFINVLIKNLWSISSLQNLNPKISCSETNHTVAKISPNSRRFTFTLSQFINSLHTPNRPLNFIISPVENRKKIKKKIKKGGNAKKKKMRIIYTRIAAGRGSKHRVGV